jgi:hypothetical protein
VQRVHLRQHVGGEDVVGLGYVDLLEAHQDAGDAGDQEEQQRGADVELADRPGIARTDQCGEPGR